MPTSQTPTFSASTRIPTMIRSSGPSPYPPPCDASLPITSLTTTSPVMPLIFSHVTQPLGPREAWTLPSRPPNYQSTSTSSSPNKPTHLEPHLELPSFLTSRICSISSLGRLSSTSSAPSSLSSCHSPPCYMGSQVVYVSAGRTALGGD